MPELPEVETIAAELREADLVSARIIDAQVFWARSVAEPTVAEFLKRVVGQQIREIQRRGKFIAITLTTDTLLVHLRMTGKFTLDGDAIKHERIRLTLDTGHTLHFEDQRKFGKWYLLADPSHKLAGVGLEPLEKSFTLAAFHKLLRRSVGIKTFLLNQKHIAGIGNIYADEALWEARIHPERIASSLSKEEISRLHRAIPLVLKRGLENKGTSLGTHKSNYARLNGRGDNQNHLRVFRRQGHPCQRCGAILQKMRVAQRGTHFCPGCQAITGV